MSKRPFTTLFLLVSVDGKLSTGGRDVLDVDSDYPNIEGVKEGLDQYYRLESETDLFSLNTGRVLAKVGVNERTGDPKKSQVSLIVVDNEPHLKESGVVDLAKRSKYLIIATANKNHPAKALQTQFENIHVLEYQPKIDFIDLFSKLNEDFGADRVTVQSGGTLNTVLVRKGLIDRLLLVVAPALIGGKNTSTLMDGKSLLSPDEIDDIKAVELVRAKPLKHSYLLLEYRVKNLPPTLN